MNKPNKTAEEKQLTLLRLQTIMIAILLILLAVFIFFLAGKVNLFLALAQEIDTAEINGAVSSLKSAADTLSKVDTESLNSGIGDLSKAAEGLSQLDFQKLGKFMDSLEELSTQMDGISSFFSKFLK